MKYIAVCQHRSEYPEPISFAKGALITVGKKYEGPEDWDNWYFCRTSDQKKGWVPGQIIEWLDAGSGRALEDFTSRELDVDEGDVLIGVKHLNGWVWCHRPSDGQSGWVPSGALHKTDNG